MARVKTPLLSNTAQGSLGETLTFSRRWGKNFARKFTKPLPIATTSQETQRAVFKGLIDEWNLRTQSEKDGWEAISSLRLPLSGYNIFLSLPINKRLVRMFGNAKFGAVYFGGPVPK